MDQFDLISVCSETTALPTSFLSGDQREREKQITVTKPGSTRKETDRERKREDELQVGGSAGSLGLGGNWGTMGGFKVWPWAQVTLCASFFFFFLPLYVLCPVPAWVSSGFLSFTPMMDIHSCLVLSVPRIGFCSTLNHYKALKDGWWMDELKLCECTTTQTAHVSHERHRKKNPLSFLLPLLFLMEA